MSNVKRRFRIILVLTVLSLLLVFGIWGGVNAGYRQIRVRDLLSIITGGGEPGLRYTFLMLRLPRVLTAVLVGMGLSVSGCILQSITGNEMAEPGVLGINAGAGLFLAAFLVFFTGTPRGYTFALPLIAFAGSLCTALLDYRLAAVRGKISPGRLLLTGIAVSTVATSLMTLFMQRMSSGEYAFVQSWLSGSIWGASWDNIRYLLPGIVLLTLFTIYKSRTLDILVLGPQLATGLGVGVRKQTMLLLGAAVGLSSLCCAVGGGISFIGLVCPHLARRLTGPASRVWLPASMLTGGVLMAWSDIISRTLLSPDELAIGVVATVIGVPYFLYLLVKT